MLIYAPQMLVVHPRSPHIRSGFHRLREEQPGKITFGSSGYGTQPHILGEMLQAPRPASTLVHVPYRGAGQSVTDLLAGQVQMIFETTAILLPHVEAGKLRPLAVATQARSPSPAGVPTTADGGYPKIFASFWSGLLAPAGTPGRHRRQAQRDGQRNLKSKRRRLGWRAWGRGRRSARRRISRPSSPPRPRAGPRSANETSIKVD